MEVQKPSDYFASTNYKSGLLVSVQCLPEREQVEIVCTYDGPDAPVVHYSSGDTTRFRVFHKFSFCGARQVTREDTLYQNGFFGLERDLLDITPASKLNVSIDSISVKQYQSDWLLRHQRLWQFRMTCGSLGTYNIVFATMILDQVTCHHRCHGTRVLYVDVASGKTVNPDFPF